MNAHMLSRKIMRQGYYWITMEADSVCGSCLKMPSLLNSFKPMSSADTGYRMKLSLTMGYISREKQRSCYDSSTFSTTNPHLTVLRLMEQLRLQIRI